MFSGLMDSIDEVLNDLGLAKEPILVRMTGCPNGCARPYNADFGFVGRDPSKYAMYVGSSSQGDRLASLEKKVVTFDEIPGEIRRHLEAFVAGRQDGESFTSFWGRKNPDAQTPTPEQFHLPSSE